jgi:hypothetical protein
MDKKVALALNWFIRDKQGRLQIMQAPNPPIIGWLAFLLLSHLEGAGPLKTGFLLA